MSVAIPFRHRRAGHCASGAFRDLLEHRGLTPGGRALSEAMVFGLGAGLDAMFLAEPWPRVPFYLAGRAPAFEESLLGRLGGALTRISEPDDDAAWNALRARLDAGEPVALVGDCQKLDYLKTRTSMPLHVVVATGYDATHVIVADNDRDELQRCAHASLRAARAAAGVPLPAMNVRFEVQWPAALPPLRHLIAPALAEVVANMHTPRGAPVALFGPQAFGLRALDALEHLASGLDGLRGPSARRAALLLWVAVDKGGTGGAFFRRMYRDFLAEASTLAPSPALAAALAHYDALAAGWAEIGALAGTGKLDGLGRRIVARVGEERRGVELLALAAAVGGATLDQ